MCYVSINSNPRGKKTITCITKYSQKKWCLSPLIFHIFFLLKLQLNNNMQALFISFCELIVTLALLFLLCELCGRVSSQFDDICNLINRFDWYLLPLEIQQLLPFIIANAQQSVDFPCFGSFACNRELFKKVKFHTVNIERIDFQCCLVLSFSRQSTKYSHGFWYFVDLDE